MRFSTLESLCFVRMIRCHNVILSSVHGWLTTLKTFTWTESSSPIEPWAKQQNCHLENGIHHHGNQECIGHTSKRMILATQGDQTERKESRQYLQDRVVGTSEGVCWNLKWISPMTIMIPDTVHTIYLSMLKHVIDYVTSFLAQHSRIDGITQLWSKMPLDPCFASSDKLYSQETQGSSE